MPKYLGQKWLDSPKAEVGKLQIRQLGQRVEVNFKLDQDLADMGDRAPVDHKLNLSAPSKSETLGILARYNDESDKEVRCVEGTIIQNAVCRPTSFSAAYNALKKKDFQKAEKPEKKTRLIGKVNQCLPRNAHTKIGESVARRPAEKRSRMDEEQLKEMLFKHFEKHQYYTLKDLVDITKQPIGFLKEVLKEIAVYNSKSTQRNMWELKPEYRHYN